MRVFILLLLALLFGCKEKELTPVGQRYQLKNTELPISLEFNPDGRFYGKALNEYWGQYHIRENIISFSGITTTMKQGTLPQMRTEKAYFNSLTNGHTFKIEKDKLKIFFDEEGILEFELNAN